ncbi:MAG: bifunctional serine/threonine-protein kinase/formylglycine-generating enzyme family protein [Planctomycetota bacterium]
MTDDLQVPADLEAAVRAAIDAPDGDASERIAALAARFPQHRAMIASWVSAGRAVRELSTLAAAPARPDRRTIGPYRVLDRLGGGGFGEVYLAEAPAPLRRRVAVKVIKLGMDTREVLVRFAAEQQVMALLDHSGIAKVFDAGVSEDGRSFFAMEYVAGAPIDRYARERHLDLTARLELFARVCDAVHYAHQHGVLHRDLSARNVLVLEQDGRALPKVIDFGIAKSLLSAGDGERPHTALGEAIGTPGFMSPEQAAGTPLDVDVRSDVYSLGTILFLLVTGTMPHRAAGRDAPSWSEWVQRGEVPAPSRVTGRGGSRRELDWIVLRALARDRRDRYDSAAALASDVRCLLAGSAVAAGPQPWSYRVGKFVRRHWLPLCTAAAVVALLAVALAFALFGLDAARRYRDLVEPLRLVAEAEELWPVHPARIPALRAWRDAAAPFLASSAGGSSLPPRDERLRQRRLADLSARARDVERALAQAEVAATTTEPPARQAVWREARAAIAAAPVYGGLVLAPQVGLVPLGRHPRTGLWEFGHPESGALPAGPGDGPVDPDAGIVFVLLPGGTVKLGAVDGDAAADDDEFPNARASVAPFLLAKHELTQGQWLRLTGTNPSEYPPGTTFAGVGFDLSHPVESVSWTDCARVLARHRLALPTEVQWEYACRAGTRQRFAFGDATAALAEHGNIADAASAFAYPPGFAVEADLDDGYRAHAPAGSYAANGFGVHDLHGNVFEWCADPPRTLAAAAAGPTTAGEAAWRMLRGGSFATPAAFARCSSRLEQTAGYRSGDVGVRPVLPVQP